MTSKLTLQVDNIKTSFEFDGEEVTFNDLLKGFLGCMFAQGYVPGTEMYCFEDYLYQMKNIYSERHVSAELFDGVTREVK